jgi:hypothetical protein
LDHRAASEAAMDDLDDLPRLQIEFSIRHQSGALHGFVQDKGDYRPRGIEPDLNCLVAR